MNNAEGSKYESTKDLGITEIAKLIRADIKAAITSGDLPADSAASVRIQRFSGGQSVSVVLTVPGIVRVAEEEADAGRANRVSKPWLTRVAYNAEATIENILSAYNFDRSDTQSDYFHVRFYTHVSVVGQEVVS